MIKIKVDRVLDTSTGQSLKLETTIAINDVMLKKVFYIKKKTISADIYYVDEIIVDMENIEEKGVTWLKGLNDEQVTIMETRADYVPYVKNIKPKGKVYLSNPNKLK